LGKDNAVGSASFVPFIKTPLEWSRNNITALMDIVKWNGYAMRP